MEASLIQPSADAEVTVVRGGIEAVRRAAGAEPARRVLAVVDRLNRSIATALLDAGADGIALESDSDAEVADAARAVAAGYIVVPRSVRQALRKPVFTTREKQILSLVVLGVSNKEVAHQLILAESTVKMHLTSVFLKLGVRSRKEAVDLILDPTTGLGTGILSLTGAREVQTGYGAPSVG